MSAPSNTAMVARLRRQVRDLDKLETDVVAARLKLGRELVAARAGWPNSGPNARGWGEFLRRIGLTQQRAWELMRLADYEEDFTDPGEKSPAKAKASAAKLSLAELLAQALNVLSRARNSNDIDQVHELIDDAHRIVTKAMRA